MTKKNRFQDDQPVSPYIPAALARHSAWETATFMRIVMTFWEDNQKGR